MTAPPETLARLRGTLNLCLALLSAGRSTHQAVSVASRAAHAWDLKRLQIVPLGRAVLVQHTSSAGVPTNVVGTVASLDGFNCEHMEGLHRLEHDIWRNGADAAEAEHRIEEIDGQSRPLWWTWGGGTLLAFCVAIQIAFALPAAILAAVLYLISSAVSLGATALRLPRLFALATQAAAVVLVALPVARLGLVAPEHAAMAAGTVAMLLVPLPQLVSTIVDAVDANAHGALARATSLCMALLGIGIGVAVGVTVARLPVADPNSVIHLATLPLLGALAFSVLGSVGNALANSGGADLLLPAAAIGLGTAALHLFLGTVVGLGPMWSAGLTAVALGIVSALWATKAPYSSTALALVGMTGALLPGLTVYQGLYAEVADPRSGLSYFASAAGTVVALAVGASFGFVVAERFILRRASAQQS